MSQGTAPADPRFWAGVFYVKGAWNCLGAVLFFFFEDLVRDRLGTPRPDPAYRAMFLALAFIFGLGYLRVGQDPTRNRDIVRGGVLGQSAVFVVLAYEVLGAGRLPAVFLVPGVVDLLFAVLFVLFLARANVSPVS
jgi:hypothetical protein